MVDLLFKTTYNFLQKINKEVQKVYPKSQTPSQQANLFKPQSSRRFWHLTLKINLNKLELPFISFRVCKQIFYFPRNNLAVFTNICVHQNPPILSQSQPSHNLIHHTTRHLLLAASFQILPGSTTLFASSVQSWSPEKEGIQSGSITSFDRGFQNVAKTCIEGRMDPCYDDAFLEDLAEFLISELDDYYATRDLKYLAEFLFPELEVNSATSDALKYLAEFLIPKLKVNSATSDASKYLAESLYPKLKVNCANRYASKRRVEFLAPILKVNNANWYASEYLAEFLIPNLKVNSATSDASKYLAEFLMSELDDNYATSDSKYLAEFLFPELEVNAATSDASKYLAEFLIPKLKVNYANMYASKYLAEFRIPKLVNFATSDASKYLENFRIPKSMVNSATKDFSRETRLENYKYCNVYKGSLLRHRPCSAAIKWHNNESYGDIRFQTQCKFHSKCNHENIIRFIGFCDDGDKKIVVTDYAINGSLDHHLKDPDKRRALTWAKRLEICLGMAKGLKYLQDHLDEGMIVLRSLCSKYILLDENMQAKICFLDNSVLVPRKQQQPHSAPYTFASDQYLDPVYLDPVHAESLLVSPEADVYSFGVVLFELMSGMLAYDNKIIEDVKPQHLIHLVRRYYDAGLEKLIDPHIRDQIDRRSFYSFGELAYKCISLNINERPTIDFIIKTLEEVLDTQKHGADSIVSHQGHPLFSSSELHSIKQHGRLTDRFQNRRVFVKDYMDIPKQFHHELDMMCSFQHENIIPFIGYCKESVEKNIVFEYATNGNLFSHLNNMCAITWAQRLNICLGAARGLRYLHSGLGDRGRVIHRTFSSSKVLLDDNMETKICGFGRSILLARNQQQAYEPFWIEEEGYKSISDSDKAYMDPVYRASGIVMTEVDIYSFGLVMFELLAGSPLNLPKLKTKLRQHYVSDPKILVDTDIRDQVESHSLHTYIELAYKCISFNLKDRPSMNTVVKTLEKLLNFQNNGIASTSTIIRSPKSNKLEDFKVPLDSIKLDTDIGCGNYGTVYKGELSEGGQMRTAAFKYLNGGIGEFRKELELIFSCIYHENVVRFIGYCDEEKHCDGKKEMIIVMEYAANGSLRNHLDEGHLSWEQRLKICLGAAKGLRHLHMGQGEDNKIIHRDVKSANILLDENMEAKICDFGLSRSTPAADTGVYAGVQGTNYYMDPIYRESGKLRTASDVYSFGVVLFEMLTGKLAPIPIESEDGKPRLLIHLVRRYKTGGIPDKLIDPCIKAEMDDHSLFTFQDIAYECISLNYKKRPTMDMIVDRIEVALEYQVNRRR